MSGATPHLSASVVRAALPSTAQDGKDQGSAAWREASLAICLQAKPARLDPAGEYLPTLRAADQHWATLVLGVPDGDDAGKILGYLDASTTVVAVGALAP
jgi:hypothetical protein